MSVCIREPLTANRTYYVRTDGNDANNGLTDDAAGAFRTIQKAVDVVSSSLDFGLYSVTIQVRAGTYAEAVLLKSYVGTTVPTLRGDTSTPANIVIAPASGSAVAVDDPSNWNVEGFKLTSANANGLSCALSGVVNFQALEFGTCAVNHILAYFGASVRIVGNYAISGGAMSHIYADTSGSAVRPEGRTVTITNTPNFSVAFARAGYCATIVAPGMTFVGSATGSRYQVFGSAAIGTGSGGANYFPGNTAGTASSGGQYF